MERLGAEPIVGCRLVAENRTDRQRLLEEDLVFAKIPNAPRGALSYDAEDIGWFDSSSGSRLPRVRPS